MNEKIPEIESAPSFTEVENIIPEIKPALPIEPSEGQYSPIRPSDAAYHLEKGLQESEKIREFFKEFSGQIVVEIGPGELLSGYNVTALANARAYIGVEPFYFYRNLKKFLESGQEMITTRIISRTCVQADALSFLKRLPDKSVSVLASQLESVMQQKYEQAVAKEIERVLHPDGALIQYDSNFQLDNNLFEQGTINPNNDPYTYTENEYLTWKLEKFKRKKI